MFRTTFVLVLDEVEIQKTGTLGEWQSKLRINETEPITDEAAWKMVYEEISRIIVGASQYRWFSMTALDDQRFFEQFLKHHTAATEKFNGSGIRKPKPHTPRQREQLTEQVTESVPAQS